MSLNPKMAFYRIFRIVWFGESCCGKVFKA